MCIYICICICKRIYVYVRNTTNYKISISIFNTKISSARDVNRSIIPIKN